MPYPPTGPADSPPCLPHPRRWRRCCIFQRFKFRKFGKFRLLELFFDCGMITHDLHVTTRTRKDTNGTVDRQVSLCARRALFDPHGSTSYQKVFLTKSIVVSNLLLLVLSIKIARPGFEPMNARLITSCSPTLPLEHKTSIVPT